MTATPAAAKPAVGRQVSWQGTLWHCWAQAPGVGQWWLMPASDAARKVLAGIKHGVVQGCVAVPSKERLPPLTQHLRGPTPPPKKK